MRWRRRRRRGGALPVARSPASRSGGRRSGGAAPQAAAPRRRGCGGGAGVCTSTGVSFCAVSSSSNVTGVPGSGRFSSGGGDLAFLEHRPHGDFADQPLLRHQLTRRRLDRVRPGWSSRRSRRDRARAARARSRCASAARSAGARDRPTRRTDISVAAAGTRCSGASGGPFWPQAIVRAPSGGQHDGHLRCTSRRHQRM